MPTNMPAKPDMPSKPASSARPAPMAAPRGKKASIIGLVGLLVGLVAGYGAGRVSTGTPVNPLAIVQGGSYQDGYNAAKKKIDDAHIFPPAPTEALSLAGTVKSIGASSLVISVSQASANPLDESPGPSERTVQVTADTVIEQQVQKTQEQLQKEQAKFQADLEAGKPTAPPNPNATEPIKLSDLKIGDAVVVTADHDILREASFVAVTIELISSASAASPQITPTGVPSGTEGATGNPPAGTAGPTGTPPNSP